MNRNILYALACIFTLSIALSSGCAKKQPAPSGDLAFTGVLVMEAEGAEPVRYAVHFTRNMQRMDMLAPGSGTAIVRVDKGVVWLLMEDKKLFIELPVRPQNKNPLTCMPDKVIKYEQVGEETIDGHPTLKEHMVIQNEGDEERDIYRWFATDIGWPVRAESVDGKWKLRLEEIVKGPQEPGLFEIPQGYNMIMGRKPHMPGAPKN